MNKQYQVIRADTTVAYNDTEYKTGNTFEADPDDKKIKSALVNKFIKEVKKDETNN